MGVLKFFLLISPREGQIQPFPNAWCLEDRVLALYLVCHPQPTLQGSEYRNKRIWSITAPASEANFLLLTTTLGEWLWGLRWLQWI